MGRGPEAVVDDRLHVHGLRGLCIADASVMPTEVSGNTQAAVLMIAEKGADLIRAAEPRGQHEHERNTEPPALFMLQFPSRHMMPCGSNCKAKPLRDRRPQHRSTVMLGASERQPRS
jgi:hypothetical protein